jgi:hypothetical protein
MPLPSPSFVMRVLAPILFPIAAAAGQFLVVWPGHPTHTVTVYNRHRRLVRHRHVAYGALYGPILMLDGEALEFLTPRDRVCAQRIAS